VTRGEDETKQIVAHVVVDRGLDVGHVRFLFELDFVTELFVFALEPLVSTERIDRAMLRRGHEPRARIVRHARLRPTFERRHERILRELFRPPDVAHDPREARDEPGRLDPPDRVDRAVRFRGLHGGDLSMFHAGRNPARTGHFLWRGKAGPPSKAVWASCDRG
jgi:hypothetical protein